MKPQTMSEERFFEEVCDLLGLDYTDSDEDDVIRAIKELKALVELESEAAKINYFEWQKAIDNRGNNVP